MSDTYLCRHCSTDHTTHGAAALTLCGCDGTRHNACERHLAPPGTPRPDNWPTYLTWRTS